MNKRDYLQGRYNNHELVSNMAEHRWETQKHAGTKNPAEFDKVMDNSTITVRNWKIKHKINRFEKRYIHLCV